MSIKILGLGGFSPSQTVKNSDFERIVETSDEWIRSRTGIGERQYSAGVPTWAMAVKAAEIALTNAGLTGADIDLIITSTITADFFTPSVSCLVAERIGALCPAFDIGAACAGFVYAIDCAERYLRTDEHIKNVLVISSEMLSRYLDFEDRSSAILFGDASAAAVITRATDVYGSFLGADGSGGKYLYGKLPAQENPFEEHELQSMEDFPGKNQVIIQNGREVYKFAVKILPEASEKAAAAAGIALSDIAWFIPHQANIRIIEAAAARMNVPLEKFIINIESHGNTSSASIPLALYEAVNSGQIKRGDTLCLVGFGAGLTYGAIVLTY
jgi:3-oxoacyl-[acyl-carrier-protein] synthase-3